VTHSPNGSCANFFLPHSDVICDLLLNRRTAILNPSVNEDPNQIVLNRVLGLKGTTYETPCEAYTKRLESCYSTALASNDFDERSLPLRLSANQLVLRVGLAFVFGLLLG